MFYFFIMFNISLLLLQHNVKVIKLFNENFKNYLIKINVRYNVFIVLSLKFVFFNIFVTVVISKVNE